MTSRKDPISLQGLLDEMNDPTSWNDLPRRIDLCRKALKMTSREAQSRIWAALHNDLAMSLVQTTLGSRAENLEEAIHHCEQALEVRTREEYPKEWALTQNTLANAYRDRIRGERAENPEEAIRHYEQALEIRTRDAYPKEWAITQNNLAYTYYKRVRGQRAENLESAILHAHQALKVYTHRLDPHYWAIAKNTLGEIYRIRNCGSRARNIERAIYHLKQALDVHTIQEFPKDWARIQNNLGNAYLARIRGRQADNIEHAIAHYQKALKVRTRLNDPEHWAVTQYNLGNAHRNRIRGDQTINIEQAIHHFHQALEVHTRREFPSDWAQARNNLGNAHLARIRGDRATNIERAIHHFGQALNVHTEQVFPEEWAQIQNNLGNAYLGRIRGVRLENIEESIRCYEQALKVRTREAFPEEWAQTLSNLAGAERTRAGENIEQSIQRLQQVLEVRTRQTLPQDWAETQNNLAIAYTSRIQGERADNIQQAIHHYEQALEVYTLALPANCLRAARALGNLAFEQGLWKLARESYKEAFDARDMLLHDSLTRASKQTELGEAQNLPPRAAYAHVQCDDVEGAIEVLEKGRAQLLRESLERRWLEELPHLGFGELCEDYKQAIEQYDAARRMEGVGNAHPEDHETQLKQALDVVQDAIVVIRKKAGKNHPQYRYFLQALPFEEILNQAQEKPLVYICSTSAGGLALVVDGQRAQAVHLPKLDQTSLQKQMWSPTDREVERINDNINRMKTITEEDILAVSGGYFSAYALWSLSPVLTNAPRELINGLFKAWENALNEMTGWLWDAGVGELVETLKKRGKSAVFIPAGQLAILPLHAAWKRDPSQPTGRLYALDEINISYVPSAHALWQANLSAGRRSDHLMAVDNPDGTLPFTEYEVQRVLDVFPKGRRFHGKHATTEAVKEEMPKANVLHFATHGNAGWQEEEQARLKLADGYLTLPNIFDLELDQARLAVLSACETGVPGLKLIDEMVGLPAGMMQAGVPGVVGSLWSVNDLSTALLMSQFYRSWRKEGKSPQEALQRSQIWLRDKLIKYKSPFYWAAFAYTGV